jgi:hypothetical protein
MHNFSGAKTYSRELLNYLKTSRELKLYRIVLKSDEYKEVSIIDEENISNIYIPDIKARNFDSDRI